MILFAGDPHGVFEPMIGAVLDLRPDAVVLLGDMTPDRPLDEVLAEIAGHTALYWIPGNHDTDTDEYLDRVLDSALADRNIHGRVVQVGDTRIAGLGGVFRGRVWRPETEADLKTANRPTKREFLRGLGKGNRWRGGLPRKHRTSIFAEDFDRLAANGADILATHEAPSCLRHGFAAIDELARRLGVRQIVHGHHHKDYHDVLADGIRVVGVGLAGVVTADGRCIEPGRASVKID